jgi:hypothetical protein
VKQQFLALNRLKNEAENLFRSRGENVTGRYWHRNCSIRETDAASLPLKLMFRLVGSCSVPYLSLGNNRRRGALPRLQLGWSLQASLTGDEKVI